MSTAPVKKEAPVAKKPAAPAAKPATAANPAASTIQTMKRKIEQLEKEKSEAEAKLKKAKNTDPSTLPRSNEPAKIEQDGEGFYKPLCIDDVNYYFFTEAQKARIHHRLRHPDKVYMKVSENRNKGKAGNKGKDQYINYLAQAGKQAAGNFMGKSKTSNVVILTPPMVVHWATGTARGNYDPKQLDPKFQPDADRRKKAIKLLQVAKFQVTLGNNQIYPDRVTADNEDPLDNERDPDASNFMEVIIKGYEEKWKDVIRNKAGVCSKFKSAFGDLSNDDKWKDYFAKHFKNIIKVVDGSGQKTLRFSVRMFRPATPTEIQDMREFRMDASCLKNAPTDEIKKACLDTVDALIPDPENLQQKLQPQVYDNLLVYRSITLEEREEQFAKGQLNLMSDTPPITPVPQADIWIKQGDVVSLAYFPGTYEDSQERAGSQLGMLGLIVHGQNLRPLSMVPRSKINPRYYYGEVTEVYRRRPNWNKWVSDQAAEDKNEPWIVPEFEPSPYYDHIRGVMLTEEEWEEQQRLMNPTAAEEETAGEEMETAEDVEEATEETTEVAEEEATEDAETMEEESEEVATEETEEAPAAE